MVAYHCIPEYVILVYLLHFKGCTFDKYFALVKVLL